MYWGKECWAKIRCRKALDPGVESKCACLGDIKLEDGGGRRKERGGCLVWRSRLQSCRKIARALFPCVCLKNVFI